MEPSRLSPRRHDQVVGEEEALSYRLPLLLSTPTDPGQAAPAHSLARDREDLDEGALAHEHLVDVQEDVTALDDHPLDGQVLPDVFRLADFVMHLPGQILELDPGMLQGLLFHVVGRGVGQQLVQRDDVTRDLANKSAHVQSMPG